MRAPNTPAPATFSDALYNELQQLQQMLADQLRQLEDASPDRM
jgi:hypothetical protein